MPTYWIYDRINNGKIKTLKNSKDHYIFPEKRRKFRNSYRTKKSKISRTVVKDRGIKMCDQNNYKGQL